MNNIAIGKYLPYNTFVHRLDPRVKVIITIMLMVSIFLGFESWTLSFAMLAINAIVVVTLMLISKVSFKTFFVQLKFLWIMVVFLALINIFVPPVNSTHIMININGFIIYWEALLMLIKVFIRIALMLMITLILTASTKPMALTDAFEWFMTPFKLIRLPAHELAMTTSLALRFIPTFIEDTERIMKAQTSRGVDFKYGSIKVKFKGIISLIVPLMILAFSRSEELTDSLEARGYDPKGVRTRYRVMKWKMLDTFTAIVFTVFLAANITLSVLNYDFVSYIINLINPSIGMW